METYYQLVDRDTSTVRIWWKALHIIFFIIVIITGYISAYMLGRSIESFGDNCILFANISFVKDVHNTTKRPLYGLKQLPPDLVPINMHSSSWGSIHLCYFCQFTPLMSMITAVIWVGFFIVNSKGGAGYITSTIYQPWRIVYPALALSVIATGGMLISTITLKEGADIFCAQFEEVFNTTRCTTAIDDYTFSFFETKQHFIVLLETAVYCSYIGLAGWVLQLAVLILRIVAITDFQLIKITVMPVGKEVLQDIINPDKSNDTLLSVSEKESTTSTTPIPKHARRFPFRRRAQPRSGPSSLTAVPSKPFTPTTIAVAPKPPESPSAHEHQRVSFIDESPITEETDTVALFNSLEQQQMLLADMHKNGAENAKETATTSFSAGKDPNKAG